MYCLNLLFTFEYFLISCNWDHKVLYLKKPRISIFASLRRARKKFNRIKLIKIIKPKGCSLQYLMIAYFFRKQLGEKKRTFPPTKIQRKK
jgi:hypothetical protein